VAEESKLNGVEHWLNFNKHKLNFDSTKMLWLTSGVARPIFFGGPKYIALGEQQYFDYDTAPQSTK